MLHKALTGYRACHLETISKFFSVRFV